jgi:hypothetical protein
MQISVPYTVPFAPALHPSAFRRLDCPPVVTCPRYPVLNFVSLQTDRWNCNRCGADMPYVSLFNAGDIIPLQFNLPDVRNINQISGTLRPQIGWRQADLLNNFWYIRAEIYDAAGDCITPVFELVEDFCADWWVGYSDKIGAIQTLFIDTSLIVAAGLDAFFVKIVTINDALTDEITIWSEPFILSGCKETLQIVSTYPKLDCVPRDYRNPTDATIQGLKVPFVAPVADSLTPFFASWRFEGQIRAVNNSSEQTLNDNDVLIRQRIVSGFELTLFPIAPYAYDILAAIIRGEKVLINGVEYINFGDISSNLEGRTFLPVISCEQVCKIDNLACD